MRTKIILLAICTLVVMTVISVASPMSDTALAAVSSFQRVAFVNGVVTATTLNVRQGPSTSHPVIMTLKQGDTVKVFGKLDTWYAVYVPSRDIVGVVAAQYIKPASSGGTPAATQPPVTVKTATPAPVKTPAPSGTVTLTANEQKILELVNKARAAQGLAPLAIDPELQKVARLKAQDMVTHNYFSHQSPTYGSPFDMMRQFGITYRTAGENIAGNSTAEGAFNAWMNSSGHRANILNSSYNFTGIGVVSSPVYGLMLVQQFIGR